MTDPTGTTRFTYDPLNRMSGKTLPSGQTISYVVDADGNPTSETDSGGTTTFTYNSLNELTAIKDPSGATTSLGYDAAYRETSAAYPLMSQSCSYVSPANGTHTAQRYSMTDQAGNVTTYTYDGVNCLTWSTTRNSAGTIIDSRSYSYDALGNRLSQTINGALLRPVYRSLAPAQPECADAHAEPVRVPAERLGQPAGSSTDQPVVVQYPLRCSPLRGRRCVRIACRSDHSVVDPARRRPCHDRAGQPGRRPGPCQIRSYGPPLL